MNTILTLIRRDLADNRGALINTPLIIAAVVLTLALLGSFTNRSQFGFDARDFKDEVSANMSVDGHDTIVRRNDKGQIVVETQSGTRTLNEAVGPKGREALKVVLPAATSIVALLPIGVCAVVVLFLLAGALYDERKDRSILFWKSLPASDLQTASAKMISIVIVGLAIAVGVGMAMQMASIVMALGKASSVGVAGIDVAAILGNTLQLWLVGLVGILVYVGWALPVYAWFLLVGAAAPKAPFVLAIVPILLAPLIAKVLNLPISIDITADPLARLTAINALHKLDLDALDKLEPAKTGLPIAEMIQQITSSMTHPGFIGGILVAAALVYASAEVRRRRAL